MIGGCIVMKFHSECDLLIGNVPESYLDEQYLECEDCYRYEICKKCYERELQNQEKNQGEPLMQEFPEGLKKERNNMILIFILGFITGIGIMFFILMRAGKK